MTETFQTISPIDGSVYVERRYASSGEIASALSAAVTAQTAWREASVGERAQRLDAAEAAERYGQLDGKFIAKPFNPTDLLIRFGG